MEEYSEGTIHKGEPEPRNGNVNTVYFINQARGNTRISRTEFIYDESMRLQNYGYLRLVFTSDGVGVGVAIRRVERYDLVKIKPTESEAEH